MFDYKNGKMGYVRYKNLLMRIIKALSLNDEHRLHDCRTHFVTQAKLYKVDDYAIKRLVGHSIKDITEKIYTKRDIDWLRTEIEKIK